jgi:hypothetical protein
MSSSDNALERSLGAGLDFILTNQAADGSWTDWELPPGSSSAWTTAYVGYRLGSLAGRLRAKAGSNTLAASRWLLENVFPDGGWGYNRATGSDADSTSFAILCLASAGRRVPHAAYAHLARYQGPDGGFSTYLSDGTTNSWTVSHPDVTPIVLLAWLTQSGRQDRTLQAGTAYVLAQRTPDGLWRSFWWNSFLYGTEASLSFLRAAGVAISTPAYLSRLRPASAFETALLISSLLHVDPIDLQATVRDLVDALLTQQRSDGSWSSAPILRITRRDCFEPWTFSAPGPLFADPCRLFTTATVLYALSRAYEGPLMAR